ncbi:MAG: hypothetical protein WAN23_10470, partial [Candidatus Acidiferrales bacterium]
MKSYSRQFPVSEYRSVFPALPKMENGMLTERNGTTTRMSDIAFKSDHSTDAGHVRRAPLDLALYTFVLLALSLIGPGGAAANADVAKAPIATARPGLSFA